MKIGIFDSGLGGLTVLERLRARLPHADLIYFADQAHVPYGDRDRAELHALLRENLRFLVDRGAEMIVMGCNTSCAVAAEFGWPEAGVPIFDLIEAGANMVFSACYLRPGIVATNATVRDMTYTKAILRRQDIIRVEEVGAPALVPLVEQGASPEIYARAVAETLARFEQPRDVYVLGCSHFPLLRDYFSRAADGVPIIDPAEAQADAVCAAVRRAEREHYGDGTTLAWTNGDPQRFIESVARLPLHLPDLRVRGEAVAL